MNSLFSVLGFIIAFLYVFVLPFVIANYILKKFPNIWGQSLPLLVLILSPVLIFVGILALIVIHLLMPDLLPA